MSIKKTISLSYKFFVIGTMLNFSSCSLMQDRMNNIGKEPSLTEIIAPTEKQEYQPVMWPEEENTLINTSLSTNSLWQDGAKTFFTSKESRKVGDIVKVIINIQDKAQLDNETERSRDNKEDIGIPNLMGVQSKISKILPGNPNIDNFVETKTTMDTKGSGKIKRQETINTEIAAIVSQILPNGNLVIIGNQEVRVNYEMRKLSVSGVVKPSDIGADNSVTLDKIAEARVSYGGKGVVSDVQQPRFGSQVLDIISPF